MVGAIGPSGSGKSSVVFAGLVPRLRGNDAAADRGRRGNGDRAPRPGTPDGADRDGGFVDLPIAQSRNTILGLSIAGP